MQNWGLKVHEIFYIEYAGVPIMFPDDLKLIKSPKKAYRCYHSYNFITKYFKCKSAISCDLILLS